MENGYVQKSFQYINSINSHQNSEQWLETELDNNNIHATKQSDGVYFCATNTTFVAVILLDHCSNPIFLQAGFPNTLPFLLIAEQPAHYNIPGATISYVYEFISGTKALTKEITKCITQFKEAKSTNPFTCVVPAMPKQSSKISLSRSKGSIYVNKTEFVNQSSRTQYMILSAMIDAFLYDFKNETTTYLKIHHFVDILNESNTESIASGVQVRCAISRIKKLFEQIGILPENIINQIYSSGYRLNHENVALEFT
jgi:hypothetical protein